VRAAIALGSNLGSRFGGRAEALEEALREMRSLGEVTAVSRFYETAPVGLVDQPDFLNAAAILETSLAPEELLERLLAIERGMGRDRSNTVAKGPRVIDLDLLLYRGRDGDIVRNRPELTLPHPALHERRFVLQPLGDVAPEWVHPLRRQTVKEMLAEL
jgi:2-amino-4-hydroxy-6-hydroxymethyldihydropteridine diphosphokinase